jgi:uncharacterized protein
MLYDSLFIKNTLQKGRGIFTTKKIPANTIIEIAPVIVMSQADRQHLDKTLLHDYIFEWGEKQDQCCMALGNIPIYNHSEQNNCAYFMDFDAQLMMIKTVRKIIVGEELTINYNGDLNGEKKLWFDAVE